MSTEITINIKCVNADKTVVTIENNVSVLNLKEKIAELMSVPASQQRLIYKGKVMKDELTLDHYGIQHEHTVHMVKGAAPASASSSSSSAPTSSALPLAPPPSTPATSSVTSPTPAGGSFPGNVSPNPFAAFGGLGGAAMGAAPGTDFNRMQEQLMRSPDMMQQIMNSPMMDNILNNPDMLRNMFLNNPQMQSMLDANPQIRHVLNDPAVLRQSMEMMRNPNAMREAMRSQDLAMSQIENLPGGFNALRRMFEEVQEPMMEAASSSGVPTSPSPGNTNATTASATNSTTPTNSAMPNPWGGNANPNTAANPYAALGGMGGMGAFGANPLQDSGLGMGGMGMGMQQDPAQMAQMMSNPMMQQMMAQMMADPAMLDQMAAMNPQLRMAVQNPQIRTMLGNPEFMRQMLNPTNMQAMSQLQQSMQTLQQNGMFGAGGPGGAPFGGGFGAGGFGANNNAFGGLNFDSLLTPNGMPNTNNSNAMFGAPSPQSAAPPVDPAVRYAAQLQQLQDMGFADQAANVRALQSSGGNVNAAVERLLGGN